MHIDISLHNESVDKNHTLHQQFYKSLFENHPDAIFIVDKNGYCIEVNSSFEKLFDDLRWDTDDQITFIDKVFNTDTRMIKGYISEALIGNPQHFFVIL